MRALCGSIITAGALIGLGLTALAFGVRFEALPDRHSEGTFQGIYYGAPSMTIALVILICSALIGLGIAFVGLAYHHERRWRELHDRLGDGPKERVAV